MISSKEIIKLALNGSGPRGSYTAEEQAKIKRFCAAVRQHNEAVLREVRANIPPYRIMEVEARTAESNYRPYTAHRVIVNELTWGEVFAVGDGRWYSKAWTSGGSGGYGPCRDSQEAAVTDVIAARVGWLVADRWPPPA